MMNKIIIIVLTLVTFTSEHPNIKFADPKLPDEINNYRLSGLIGTSLGAFTIGQIMQYESYWSDRTDFYIMTKELEYDDALLADKAGHFFFSYGLAKTYAKTLEWTGMSVKNSRWVGAAVSLTHQTYVEINDGFSEGEVYLGFSIGDQIANTIGAGLPVLQYYYPKFESVNFKISFIKSQSYYDNNYNVITHDYESTYHWMSINLFEWTRYRDDLFPGIFALAIGHSVKGLDRAGAGYHEFYLGLDINWKHLLRYDFVKNNYYLQLIIEVLDKYKFPLPTLKISPQITAYGFYR